MISEMILFYSYLKIKEYIYSNFENRAFLCQIILYEEAIKKRVLFQK